ncbi:hypothetical protein [Goodfellowiella coeruleoviolacea]|uniref:Uncharacterized protein n=1 Tax=Goodfellowiella coeruleoviolacea TaxID=334858 RepID=A0AAE3GFN6_9PSEU|nr:hypothetical protein [Goodfellowiella coeruleoviolacea]MCP2167230.1 hypothetical protein [Goodfellowiella coeruleoviolacea]
MIARVLLAVLGLAALAWGAWCVLELAGGSVSTVVELVAWLVGGPVLHDVVLAPVAGGLGWLLAHRLGPVWATPVRAGATATGVLVLLAVPLLWRLHSGPVNPGLHDRDHPLGVALALAVVWLLVLLAGLVRTARHRRRHRPGGLSPRSPC